MKPDVKSFSPKQRRVLSWWTPKSPYGELDAIICDGAVRSGKTFSMGVSFILWAMASFDGMQFGMCGKTIASLRRNVLNEVLPYVAGLGFEYSEKLSQNLITIRIGKRENSFYIFGGRDESSAALIQGITFAGVLMDEVALMPRSFVEQACARCSVAGSRLWFNCNPEGPVHWFYNEWIKQADSKKALYIHFTMDDNPSLTQKVKDRYRSMFSGVFYKRFVLGQWVAAKGLVYDFFDPEACPDADEEGIRRWCVSCDYGTANPASFGLWGMKGGVWYRVKEYYFDSRREGQQKTDGEYVMELKKLLGQRRAEAIIVDPSAASFIEALRREGLPVCKADNDVLSGIRTTADMLKTGRVVICRQCGDAIREFQSYCWDDSGQDRVKKEHDHAMDEIRYFCVYAAAGQDRFAVAAVARRI